MTHGPDNPQESRNDQVPNAPDAGFESSIRKAEFDQLADDYHAQHQANVAITGEDPEYFSEYKIADLARHVAASGFIAENVLDFGSGTGNSIPYFRKYFPQAALTCADVSSRSMEISQGRFPGQEQYVRIEGASLQVASGSQDIVFSACVFHHIPHAEHVHWLSELLRITRPGGVLAIYEHNPLNPLTVHAVNTCPLDENAHLIRAGVMRRRSLDAGWEAPKAAYKLFFPALLSALRPLEQHLGWCALGAQYRMTAIRPQ